MWFNRTSSRALVCLGPHIIMLLACVKSLELYDCFSISHHARINAYLTLNPGYFLFESAGTILEGIRFEKGNYTFRLLYCRSMLSFSGA